MTHNEAIDTTPLENYVIGREIGAGSFARVYQAKERKSPYGVVAIKSVLRARLTQKLLENLDGEISILKAIRHPHIVALIEITNTGSHIHLVMEFCPLGDLSFFIKKREKFGLPESVPILQEIAVHYPSVKGAGLNETLVCHFLQQLASALKFLRSKNLIHRDVKPQNLLLEPPSAPYSSSASGIGLAHLPVLKLADFGFARYLQEATMADTLCGSPLYMAPEILRSERYDASIDLWSVGTVLFEMLVGKPPFRANNHVELLRKIERAKDEIKFPVDVSFDRQIQDLIRSLLRLNPENRISFDQFFRHRLITEPLKEEIRHIDEATALEHSVLRRPSHANSSSRPITVPNNQSQRGPRSKSPVYSQAFITDFIPPNTPVQGPAIRTNQRDITQRTNQNRVETQAVPTPKHDQASRASDEHARPVRMKEEFRQESPAASPRMREMSELHQAQTSDAQLKDSRRSGSTKDLNGSKSRESEGEYVVIRRETVEVNALADAMAEPIRPVQTLRKHSSSGGRFVPSNMGSPPVSSSNAAVQALAMAEQRLGTSPASALARALNIANRRLFGASSPTAWLENMVNPNSPQNYGPLRAIGTRSDSIRWTTDQELLNAEEELLIRTVEEFSTKSIIVYEFGELKWRQLQSTSSSNQFEATLDSLLTNEAIVSLCEEATALYLKTLQLLQKNIDAVQSWLAGRQGPAPSRLNEIVQWTRSRYNEVLEKAEHLQSRRSAALTLVAPNYPFEPVTAEKLLYDRALDLSRGAAVNEIVGADLSQCEGDYETSVLMLEAILVNSSNSELGSSAEKIEEDDRNTIERWISLTRTRLTKLREKVDQMKTQSVLLERPTSSEIKIAPALAQDIREPVY